MRRLLRGAGAGLVATGIMSLLMLGAKRLGLMGTMPPEKITRRLLNRLGLPHSRRQQDAAATLLHFTFGGGAGGLFGLLLSRGPLPPVVRGMAFGATVWFVSYQGWVPALGIMARPSRDRPGRPQTMLAAHLLYGAVLGLLAGRHAAPPGPRPVRSHGRAGGRSRKARSRPPARRSPPA